MTSSRLKAISALWILLALAACAPRNATTTEQADGRAENRGMDSMELSILPTPSPFPPTPTETPLPPLVLPTEPAGSSSMEIWPGKPTYSESQPGMYFRVEYYSARWGLAENSMGFPILAHRLIPSCIIAPTSGRGLPSDSVVERSLREVGAVNYEINTVSRNGVVEYVNYFGGDGIIFTGFQVTFQEQMDRCIQDAEVVLASLRSMPLNQVTPMP